ATDVGDYMLEQPRAPGGSRWMSPQVNRELFPEGELLLQALNGFVIAVTGDGCIFYISPTVQDYLGFHQSDLIHQSVYELIHTDDRAVFHHQLHRAPVSSSSPHAFPMELLAGCSTTSSPEEPSFMERSFTCRFRCLLDNSSGFLALRFHGRLKRLLGQQKSPSDRSPFVFFAIATVLQPFSILELRTETLIFQTKHKLDFTPVACDSQGTVVLGYTETELCRIGSGYQFVHAADMMYCAESHIRMMKTGESGLIVFRLLTKKGAWVWVQGNARLVYKGGKPDCIIAQQRALSDEEGEENLWKRNLQLPFTFVTGEAILYRNDLPETLDSFQAKEEPQIQAHSHPKQCLVDPNPLLGPVIKQDASIYSSHADNVLQLIAELDGLSQDEGVSDAKDSDSLLVIIETLFEKSEVDGNISQALQSLNMDTAELQWWEDALLSLGAEKSPAQEVGTEVASYMEQMFLGQDVGKSMVFLPCNEENGAAAHLQHCWAAQSVFQGPAQTQAPGAQGQDAVVPLVSISSAQPEQQVLSNPAGLVEGTVLNAPFELAKPGQGLQAGVPTSAPMDNTVPNDDIQPGGKLVGSSCPPPLHSNTPVTQWHNVPVQANPGNALGQSTSGGCQPDAWIALKHLEEAETHLESQPVLSGRPKSLPEAELLLLPSQPAPCPVQGLHESLFSHGDLHEEEAVLPARASPEDGDFPKRPHISHLEPSLSWEREQAVFQEDKWSMQWLLQAGAAPCCSGARPVQHSSLLLGSSVGPTLPDHDVLPECQYGNSLFSHESNFFRDTPKDIPSPASCCFAFPQ
ncbi:LOW QUALITY PROTEIN: aryl hydrocarbon receptor-like, partial [Pezoporus wallicus]|uniref:LOW QUALITY PROTEIN: aryl hydrocarbon receptor-like n=1 Tax=Pezoporus wallicus TaxID=35540 RepID=UPI00254DBCB9